MRLEVVSGKRQSRWSKVVQINQPLVLAGSVKVNRKIPTWKLRGKWNRKKGKWRLELRLEASFILGPIKLKIGKIPLTAVDADAERSITELVARNARILIRKHESKWMNSIQSLKNFKVLKQQIPRELKDRLLKATRLVPWFWFRSGEIRKHRLIQFEISRNQFQFFFSYFCSPMLRLMVNHVIN